MTQSVGPSWTSRVSLPTSSMLCFSFCKKCKLFITHLPSWALTLCSDFLSWLKLLLSCLVSLDGTLFPWPLQSGQFGWRSCGRKVPGPWCCWLYPGLWPDGVGLNEREGTWEVSLQGRNEGLRKQIEVYWWCPLCGLGGLSSGRLWPAPALPV